MLRADDDRQLFALARELMETEGLTEVEAVHEAWALLDALRTYAETWDRRAAAAERAQRLKERWYGGTEAR